MATLDAFSQQIVKLVRSMSDDAILALVKHQLGVGGRGAGKGLAVVAAASRPGPKPGKRRRGRPKKAAAAKAPVAAKPAAAPVAAKKAAPAKPGRKPGPKAKAVKKAAAPKKARAGRGGADRHELLGVVERVIKSGGGMAASEVAKAAGIPQSRATVAIKELKLAKRIFQGGDRRFARYAGDARTAQQASENARKTAAGPILKGKKKR
jgi:hypothetical protein